MLSASEDDGKERSYDGNNQAFRIHDRDENMIFKVGFEQLDCEVEILICHELTVWLTLPKLHFKAVNFRTFSLFLA